MSAQGGEYELDEALFMIGQLYYREQVKNSEIKNLELVNARLAHDNIGLMQKLEEKEQGGDE